MLDPEIISFMQLVECENEHIYIVGGYVRDLFLSRTSRDIDMATSMDIRHLKILLENLSITINYYNYEYGTIKIKTKNYTVEITQFRLEYSYKDYRRPIKIQSITNRQLDSRRRDFTINSLYMNMEGKIDDFHGGLSDLNAGILRTIRCPHIVFKEDSLRIIRFYRLLAQLNFKPDKDSLGAAQRNINLIEKLSLIQRKDEMIKLLSSSNFNKMVHRYPKEIECIYKSSAIKLQDLNPSMTWQEKLAMIYSLEELMKLTDAWQLNKKEKRTIITLNKMYYSYPTKSIEQLMIEHGSEQWFKFMEFMTKYSHEFKEKNHYLKIAKHCEVKGIKDLDIKSKDLKTIQVPANQRQYLLNYLLFNVIWHGIENKKQTLLEKIREVQI